MIFRCILISTILDEKPKNKEQTVARWLHLVATLLKYQTPLGRIRADFIAFMIRLVIHILVGVIDSNIVPSTKEVM